MAEMYAVLHRTCGHAVSVSPDRAGSVRLRGVLADLGYHAFRVRILSSIAATESAIVGLLASQGTCATCKIDISLDPEETTR